MRVVQPPPLRTAIINVTSAEFLALFTTPKVLIPAPGVGKIIQLVAGTIAFTPVTTPYATADGVYLNHDVAGTSNISDLFNITGVAYRSVKQFQLGDDAAVPGGWNANIVDNAAIYLGGTIANPTVGDGTFKLYLQYRIVTL